MAQVNTCGRRWEALLREIAVSATAIALVQSPAFAQEPTQSDSAVNGEVTEILVTARKRAEDGQKIPESVTVLGEDSIAALGISEAGDLAKSLPNISFRQDLSPTSSFIAVRGITAVRNSEPAVALVVDGVPASSASQIRQELFDVQQIEVLKGPQGALYGRNAIGGAINVVTKKPGNDFEGRAGFGFGNAEAMSGFATISGPLVQDKLFFRVSGLFYDDNGTILNPAVGKNVDFKTNKTGRIRLLFTPNTATSVDFKFNHDEYKGGAYNYEITRPFNGAYPIDRSRNSNHFDTSPRSVPISVDYSTIDDASLNISHDMGFATLSSISAWSKTKERYGIKGEGIGGSGPGDLDFGPAAIVGSEQSYAIESWSQELRLTSSNDSTFRWQIGGYYTRIDRSDVLAIYVTDGVSDLANTSIVIAPNGAKRKINAYAAFGQIDYSATDALTLTAALRYDHEDRSQFNRDTPLVPTRNTSFNLPTPKFSISYNVDDRNMVYATAARGFRSGGFNDPKSTRFGPIYKQEEVWSYEAGYKGSLFDRALRVNAAIFHQDIKNKQDFLFDGVVGAQTIFSIPKSWVRGVELDLSARLGSGLTLTASGGLMDSKITAFSNGPDFTPAFPNSAVIGNKLPGFSHWSASFGADYSDQISADYEAKFNVNYSIRGDAYWDVSNNDKEQNVGLLGASATIQSDRWGLTVWGTNLLNKQYWSGWFHQDFTTLPDIGNRAEQRRYGVKVHMSF